MTKVFVLTYMLMSGPQVATATLGPFIAYSECDKAGQQIKTKFGGLGLFVRVHYDCIEMTVAPRH